MSSKLFEDDLKLTDNAHAIYYMLYIIQWKNKRFSIVLENISLEFF